MGRVASYDWPSDSENYDGSQYVYLDPAIVPWLPQDPYQNLRIPRGKSDRPYVPTANHQKTSPLQLLLDLSKQDNDWMWVDLAGGPRHLWKPIALRLFETYQSKLLWELEDRPIRGRRSKSEYDNLVRVFRRDLLERRMKWIVGCSWILQGEEDPGEYKHWFELFFEGQPRGFLPWVSR